MLNPFEQLEGLQPGAEHNFEHVVSEIFRATLPGAKQVRVYRGDEGVDTFTGDWGSSGQLDVYQMKFFTDKWGDSQKQQIKASYQKAAENKNYNLKTWTLVVPARLTASDHKWYSEWKEGKPHTIELIDGDMLTDKLKEPACANARQLMREWGAKMPGSSNSSLLVPSFEIFKTPDLEVVIRVKLKNEGDQTAKNVRIQLRHSETGTCAIEHDDSWWRELSVGGVTPLNPRHLEARKGINPGELAPILPIPFIKIPSSNVELELQISAEDYRPTKLCCSLTPDDLRTGKVHPFLEHHPQAVKAAPAPKVEAVAYSEAAQAILDPLLAATDLSDPALHVLHKPHPSDPTLAMYFVAETSATGSKNLVGMKTRLLASALDELRRFGLLAAPVPAPGRQVYEFIRQK